MRRSKSGENVYLIILIRFTLIILVLIVLLQMVVGAIIAVGSIAALTDSQLLAFIKSLKGTGGLKNYYRVFRLALNFNGAQSVHLVS